MSHEVAMAPILKALDTNFRDRWSSLPPPFASENPRHFGELFYSPKLSRTKTSEVSCSQYGEDIGARIANWLNILYLSTTLKKSLSYKTANITSVQQQTR